MGSYGRKFGVDEEILAPSLLLLFRSSWALRSLIRDGRM